MGKIYEALELAREARQDGNSDGKVLDIFAGRPAYVPEKLFALSQPDSVLAECFRFLRATIIRPAKGEPPRTILVTSALMGEGKTFIASNLAASISQGIEDFVLLVDTDLRRSAVHEIFGMNFSKEGLSTYLSQNKPLPSLLKKTVINKLSILPAGDATDKPAELLSSEKMKTLIQEVRNRYADRFVVIDSAPVELAPETVVVASEVDAVIFVVKYGETSRHAVKSAMEKLQKEKILGVVFNGYQQAVKVYQKYGYKNYGYRKKSP